MAYLDSLLQPGEAVLARSRPHWIILLPPFGYLIAAVIMAIVVFVAVPAGQFSLIGYAIAAVLFVGGLIRLAGAAIARSTTEYGVTNIRVVQKSGLFSLHTVEMGLDKVESVDVDQSIIGRVFGFGTIAVHGVGARWDPIVMVEDPLGFRSAITTRAAP